MFNTQSFYSSLEITLVYLESDIVSILTHSRHRCCAAANIRVENHPPLLATVHNKILDDLTGFYSRMTVSDILLLVA